MLYIHIPYCKGKCIYCDFYSTGLSNRKEFIKALIAELSSRGKELDKCLSSIYIGGGTPSLLTPEEFRLLADELHSFFTSRGISFSDGFEFTVEVNPEDVDPERISAWKEAGVNRISMGVQSLNDEELAFLKRRHDVDKALRSIDLIASNFDNFSLDFIYAIPGQTIDSLKNTLSRALRFHPPHISVYALTYERNTPLDVLRSQGRISAASDEVYNLMDRKISEQLREYGMERYEISNYALPGYRAKHNAGYWKFRPYLGLGPGASSYNGMNIRRSNPPDLKGYIKHFIGPTQSAGSFYEEEILDKENRLIEFLMVSLRCREGIDIKEFEERFGNDSLSTLLQKCERFIAAGDLIVEGNRLHLSEKGIPISDFILESII